MRVPALLLSCLLLPLAGCLEEAPEATGPVDAVVPADPLAAGPLQALRSEWDLGQRVVQGDAGVYLVRVHGSLHLPDGDGPAPVVLLMHGRHSTCDLLGERKLQPCPEAPPAAGPVDSYTGYDYLAEHLASHGLAVLSLDANNVNDLDNEMGAARGDDYGATARARIVLDVLAALRDAHEGSGEGGLEAVAGRLDLSRVGLMGHSRGGEGVARAWEMARDGALPDGVSVGAVFALAPSDFFAQDVRGVPFATLLPYCDGDVYDLSGARLYDNARLDNPAPIHQFLVMGSNHNDYNTVWTGDDWGSRDDPWCDRDSPTTGRDEPEAQRRNGVAIMGAFFRAYLDGEADLLPYLAGHEPWPVPGVVTSHQPPGARGLFSNDGHDRLGRLAETTGGVRARSCTGTDCPATGSYNAARQTALTWDGFGTYSFNAASPTDTLSLRLGVDPATVAEDELRRIRLVVSDADGRPLVDADLASLGAFVPPGQASAKTMLNTLRVPLPDGAHRAGLAFHGGAGVVQVADWLYV